MEKLKLVEATQMKTDLPPFKPGDTVNVHVRAIEGAKQRTQQSLGPAIRRRRGVLGTTLTVVKVWNGVGVERIFLLHAPRIAKIEVTKQGNVRRAKMYYLRALAAKQI